MVNDDVLYRFRLRLFSLAAGLGNDWLYPVIAPASAIVTAALLPPDLAAPAIALAVVTWFLVVVVGASIDYLLEPALMERPRP